MAKSVLDIVIKTVKQGGGDKETVKGLVDLKAGVSQATAVFAALAGAAYLVDKALDATAGKYFEYAQRVKETKLALGLSADETSRVIALTDDLGISYDDLAASIKKNADNTNYSIEGLAAASTAYLKLGDAQERAKFAQELYGKQWQEFSKLLEKGPEQVRSMAAAVDDAHLFDDTDLAEAERYRVEMDRMHDTWEGLAMTVGSIFGPRLTDVMAQISSSAEIWFKAEGFIGKFKAGIEGSWSSLGVLLGVIDPVNEALDENMTAASNAASMEQIYADSARDANTALGDQSRAIEEVNLDFGDQLTMIEKVSKASAKQVKEIAYNNLVAKLSVDGLTAAEKKVAEEAGKALGIFNDASIKNASSIEALTKRFMEGKISVEEFNAELTRIEREINVVVTMSQVGLTVAGTGQGFCFVAGTLISMSDGSFKPIEDVTAGDVVLSYNTETGEILSATVEGTYQHTAEQMENGYLLINGRIGVTDNHPLYINGQWANAGTLKVQDLLKTVDGDLCVEIIEQVDEQVPTFNLHIDHDSHNYFADGILAHNKASGGLAYGPGDGSSDTFAAMLANGEFVVNARAVREPGMLDLLNAINSGKSVKSAGGGGSRHVNIYGGVQIVANRNVNDILAELSG